ncbi:MAG: site-2 protease family protein [Chloroflexi bacterium]|nr:site-2 protease family protein [Chloroflexota bacterium]
MLRLIAGGRITITIHWSWLGALLLAIVSLAIGRFPALHPEWPVAIDWLAAVVTAVLAFGSILVHELAHVRVAISRGVPVEGITLFVFGGASRTRAEPPTPAVELRIAAAGPAASSGLASGCAAMAWLLDRWPGGAGGGAAVTASVLWQVALVNASIAAFNLLPALPLDGGRIARSLLWHRTGDRRRATRLAVFAGRTLATALLVWGMYQALWGDLIVGGWSAALGLFLDRAAVSHHEGATVDVQRLAGDERRRAGGEEDDRVSNLTSSAQAPHGDGGGEPVRQSVG